MNFPVQKYKPQRRVERNVDLNTTIHAGRQMPEGHRHLLALRAFWGKYKNKKLLITTHSDPDQDGIVSAEAMRSKFRNSSILVAGQPYLSAYEVIRAFGIPVRLAHDIDFSAHEGLIIVDTASKDRVPHIPPGMPILAIVNHRRKAANGDLAAEWVNVNDNTFASTAEILAYTLPPENRRIAHLLAIGIYSDTDFLKRKANERTRQIFNHLMGKFGIPLEDVSRFIYDKFTVDERRMMLESIRGMDIIRVRGYMLAEVRHGRADNEHLSAITSGLLRYADLIIAMAYKATNGMLISIKSRSDEGRISCYNIMKMLMGKFGGSGGGHRIGAGGSVNATPQQIVETAKGYLETIV